LQFTDPEQAAWPTTYYGEESGIGLAMRALPAEHRRVGVVGLGTGSLTVYGKAGDYFRIYEINPEVERLARSKFSYLSKCGGTIEIAPGDARLSMEREPVQNFDLLALDAFSSDAIPVHLLTRESFDIYQRHMRTNGIIAVHVSNHYLNLEPVVVNLAREFGYNLSVIDFEENEEDWWLYASTWILLSRSQILKAPAIVNASSAVQKSTKAIPLWTDDFASLFQILK
jgi:spermidine synthase